MLSRIVKVIQNTVNNDLCLRVPPFGPIFCWKEPAPPKKKTASTMIPKIFGRSYQSTIIPSHYGSNSNSKIMCVSSPPLVSQEKKTKKASPSLPPQKGGFRHPKTSPVFSTQATEVNFTTRGRQLRHLRFGAKAVLVSTGWMGRPVRWGWGERSPGEVETRWDICSIKIDPKQGIFFWKEKEMFEITLKNDVKLPNWVLMLAIYLASWNPGKLTMEKRPFWRCIYVSKKWACYISHGSYNFRWGG